MSTVVVTVKKYEASTAFSLNTSKMDPKVHFLLFHVLKLSRTVLETMKNKSRGSLYWY